MSRLKPRPTNFFAFSADYFGLSKDELSGFAPQRLIERHEGQLRGVKSGCATVKLVLYSRPAELALFSQALPQ
jgi:hypothetical protein